MCAYRDEYGKYFGDGKMHYVGRGRHRTCDWPERTVHEMYMQLAYGIGALEDDYSEDSMP